MGGPRGPLGAAARVGRGARAGCAEAPGDLVERGEHLGGFQVEEGQGSHGGAQFAHGHGGAQPAAHHVADDEGGAVAGELDDVEPVAAHLGRRVAGQIPAGDVEPGGLGVAGWQQAALEDQRALVLAAVEAGVVDADGGACREFGGQGAVAFAEGLASLGTGELHEADHGVVGDQRHGERRLDEAAVVARHVLDMAGAQGDGTGRAEGVVVHGAECGRTGRPGLGGARTGAVVEDVVEAGVGPGPGVGLGVGQNVRDGAGEGDAAQLGGAADGFPAQGAPRARRRLLTGEQGLVEVDGGEVAEAGHGDVEEFAGGRLQVEGVADAGARFVEQGEVAPGAGRLTRGDVAPGHIGGKSRDADGAARAAVHAVEVHRPVAADGVAGERADELEVGDGVAGGQDVFERGRQPVRLHAGEVVVDRAAPVVLRPAAEDGGEPLVGPHHGKIDAEQHEAERRLTENRLRGREVRLDETQRADVHDDTDRGPFARRRLARHHIDLGEPVHTVLARHPEGDEARPLLAVEHLTDPPAAVLAQFVGYEGLDRVLAHRLVGGNAEEAGGPAAPLLDQAIGADREGGDLDVVVDRARRTALPHDIARCPRYFAHATVPSSSHTGPVLPAVFSTTAPTDTAFTITARSQSVSARF